MLDKKKEKEYLDELCNYVKKEILRYGDDKGMPKQLFLRIKGIAHNTHIVKGKDSRQVYSYKVILYSFKIEKTNILYILDHQEFSNENHKINYIMRIIESHLNDIVDKLNKKERENAIIDNQTIIESPSKYIKKTENINDKKKKIIDDMWGN